MTTKITFNNIADSTLATLTGPKVTTVVYPGTGSATDIAGGETINLTGGGFQSGCSVLVASTAASVVTFINSTQVSFIAPPLAAGTYVIYVINPDGGTAISIPGISYSGVPNWTTSAGTLGNVYEQGDINATFLATGDNPVTYTLYSGTLPPGSTLNSTTGFLSGTAPASSGATTYSFVIRATDAQNQVTNRSFSLTIDTDVVTWANPARNSTINLVQDTAISNISLSATSAAGASVSYSADSLPTGLTLTSGVISGTPTVAANTSTVLTATASTTRLANNSINWVVVLGGDMYLNLTTLLLTGRADTFVRDASTNNFPVTIAGDTKPTNFNPYLTGWSNYFDGTGDFLTTPSNVAFDFASADLTIEFWAYTQTSGYQSFVGTRTGDTATTIRWGIFKDSSNLLAANIRDTASNDIASFTHQTTMPLNQWVHCALVRNGTTFRLYQNGVQSSTSATSSAAVANSSTSLRVGSFDTSVIGTLNGYLSNLRLVKGTALYTANFTPSTQPLTAVSGTSLLTCQSNRIVDNSTNNFTITRNGDVAVRSFSPFTEPSSTNGSAYFATGNPGSYVSIPTSTLLDFGASDFTVECWIYPIVFNSVDGAFMGVGPQSGSASWILRGTSSGALSFTAWTAPTTAGIDFATSNNAVTFNAWNHVAVTRAGNLFTIWVNGVSAAAISSSSAIANTGRSAFINYGYSSLAGRTHTAYISNVRWIKGTAVYTASFTPSNTPLTAVSGTSLLTLQNNTPVNNSSFLDSSTNNFLVTRTGNTTQGTFSPYSPSGWSNYFDGTGDYLTAPSNQALTFGTGDFTIECWFYKSGSTTVLVSNSDGGVNNTYFVVDAANTNAMIQIRDGGGQAYAYGPAVQNNTWTHIAVTRQSSSVRVFVDGVSGTPVTITKSIGARATIVGGFLYTGFDSFFNGYISNVRINNSAIYTSNFTPPTAPLSPIAGTSLLTCADNRFIDKSPNNFAITRNGDTRITNFSPFKAVVQTPISYSAYFDGTGDYLTAPAAGTFNFGTQDFTVELWVFSLLSTTSLLVSNDGPTRSIGNISFFASNSGFGIQRIIDTSGNAETIEYTGSLITSQWNHLVAVKSGANIQLYLNGTLVKTQISAYTSWGNEVNALQIGRRAITGYEGYVAGCISNLRVVKGTAVYTANFTPSTQPLTAIAGTSLLTCQSATFVDNSTNRFAITAAGDARPTVVNPFGSTFANSTGYTAVEYSGSAYFDGSGDYLTVPNNPLINFGNRSWTAEMWIYPSGNYTTYNTLFAKRNHASLCAYEGYLSPTNGYLGYYNGTLYTSTATPVSNAWNHVVYVFTGTNIQIYLNGVLVLNSATTNADQAVDLYIGIYNLAGTPYDYYFGYMAQFSLMSGATYTSNFAPPIAPASPVKNTVLLLNATGASITDATTKNVLETVGDAKISTAVSKFGGSSIYFDGTGDYLFSSSRQNYAMGTGDFTMELWYYPITANNSDPALIGNYNSTWQSGCWTLHAPHSAYPGKYSLWVNNYAANPPILLSTSNMVLNSWVHLAITRSGNTWRLFVNGVIEATTTSSISLDNGTGGEGLYIGANFYAGGGGRHINANINDLRITRGLARYTANFTPPTSALLTK